MNMMENRRFMAARKLAESASPGHPVEAWMYCNGGVQVEPLPVCAVSIDGHGWWIDWNGRRRRAVRGAAPERWWFCDVLAGGRWARFFGG